MTKFYNDLHNELLDTEEIANYRALHAKLSSAVLGKYGFDDIDLCYGFHEVPYLPDKDNVRYTMSENARLEVLSRLAELNRKRYELEVNPVAQVDSGVQGGAKKEAPRGKSHAPSVLLGDLFDGDGA
jgi:hypothetical protein